MLNLLVCSGTHANAITELALPNNFDITIYGFLSLFHVKEKNNWSTFGKHEKATGVMTTAELLSHFLANISRDFCLSVWSWFTDFMKAKDQLSCICLVATMQLFVWWVGMLKYDRLKIAEMHVFALKDCRTLPSTININYTF